MCVMRQDDLPLPVRNVRILLLTIPILMAMAMANLYRRRRIWISGIDLSLDDRFREKASLVFRATKKHAMNLARFASIYKITMLALKRYGATPGKEGMIYFSPIRLLPLVFFIYIS